jgi:Fe-S cluster biogenesis protein NfuA/nitrite reductase/ring-hydroxylating ferredoxin subunit
VGNKTQETAETIEGLLDEIGSAGDPRVGAKAEELVRTLMELYGDGLSRVVELSEPGALATLAADELVGGLLVLHDLHPQSTEERVTAALEKVRPYLGSHSGGVELLGVDGEGVVHLRLQGSCDGCPSSTVTVQMAIENAISAAAPEVTSLDVEGMTETVESAGPGGRPLLPLSAASAGGQPAEPEWIEVDELSELAPGGLLSTTRAALPMLLSNVDGEFYAYRDRCAACGCSMAEGSLAGAVLSCPECQSRYDLKLAGRGVGTTAGGVHLDPLPLLTEDGHVQVAVAAR